ncbi:MAG: hypothetical protein N2Z65_05270 [Clostridiales bacterium]|nr:hypothetical protein [Clostridiales bacterium]
MKRTVMLMVFGFIVTGLFCIGSNYINDLPVQSSLDKSSMEEIQSIIENNDVIFGYDKNQNNINFDL